ncbi:MULTISPECIES: glycosyltransferase family 4 protein [unclassified Endozoicomonas]|uniref:glycosyltransferase family 4 protein n=1 Tax=unclassified Endozoicomonas TaxID=2644528 RepID=UPI002148CCD7|nr:MULTISPECIES: glycosyltransferase family 4 protein [unclassified Endozoicomonas]
MRCLIVTPYKKQYGGVESVNKLIDRILRARGWEIEYITIEGEVSSILKYLAFFMGLPLITASRHKKSLGSYDIVICNGEFGFGIEHANVYNIHHGSYYGYGKCLIGRRSLKQFLIHLRGSVLQKFSAKDKINIAVSDYVQMWLAKQNIVVDALLPNAVELPKLINDFEERNGKGLFVTSDNYYAKGMDVINELVSEYGHSIDYVCPHYVSDLKATYLGFIDKSEMQALYSQYSYVILPSRFEGMSMSLLEAMANGTPVVTSFVGNGEQLYSIEPSLAVFGYSANDYSSNINKILNDWKRISGLCRDFVQTHHSYEIYTENFEKIFLGNKSENVCG